MDNTKEKLHVSMSYDEAQTSPLALHETPMARADRRLRWTCLSLCICWAVSLIATVIAFVWLWNQYDYESSTELSGVYNLVDSEGNVISSDLTPEDVIRIVDTLDGEGKENQNQN